MFKHIKILYISIGILSLLQCATVWGKEGDKSQSTTTISLSVNGEVEHEITLNGSDLSKMPRHKVKAKDHDGKTGIFEGVYIEDILKQAGVPLGKELRGKTLSKYLVVKASDGYQVIFTLAELDSYFTKHVVVLADHRDGKPLSDTEGPLRIVIPEEKQHARWIHQVSSFTIGHVEGYSKPDKAGTS